MGVRKIWIDTGLAAIFLSAAAFLVLTLISAEMEPSGLRVASPRHQALARIDKQEVATQSTRGSSGNRAFNSLEAGYRWNPVDPGIAENEKDAAWLNAHGYPGPDVEKYLMSLSIDALRTLAGKGSQPAQAILAYRLAGAGASADEFMEILDRSAAAGFVYATKMTADILQTVPNFKNPELARAYYGLLLRRGDQGGIIANTVFGSGLSPEQLARARVLEEVLWRKLTLTRMQLYGVPFDPSIRPGFILLIETVQKSDDKSNGKG